jgi:hypothetical protein
MGRLQLRHRKGDDQEGNYSQKGQVVGIVLGMPQVFLVLQRPHHEASFLVGGCCVDKKNNRRNSPTLWKRSSFVLMINEDDDASNGRKLDGETPGNIVEGKKDKLIII